MNRRGFLKAILTAGVAPYVVTTAGVLMPVRKIQSVPWNQSQWYGIAGFGAYGDGVHDDTAALQAFIDAGGGTLRYGVYRITSTLVLPTRTLLRDGMIVLDSRDPKWMFETAPGAKNVELNNLTMSGMGTGIPYKYVNHEAQVQETHQEA